MTDPRMTPTNDAPVTVEQADIAELRAFLATYVEESDGDLVNRNACDPLLTWGILRRLAALASAPAGDGVDMILHCPACGVQHIDEPSEGWDNPPHRSHLCLSCGHIWRPADVPTNGVVAIKTKGSADTTSQALARPLAAVGEQTIPLYTFEEAWDELVNVDDRTSPEEYPDMCLITRDELRTFMEARQYAPALQSPPAKVEG